MEALDRQSDIGTLKKERGDIFLELCAKIFKAIFLRYFNETRFEMVKTNSKDAYLEEQLPQQCKMTKHFTFPNFTTP